MIEYPTTRGLSPFSAMDTVKDISYKTKASSFKKGGKACYIATPILNGVVTREEFVQNAARKGGLDEHLVDFVEKLLEGQVKEIFQAGKRLEMDNFACGITIQGRFDGVDDGWDASRHKFVPTIHFKGGLAKCLDKVTGTNVMECATVVIKSVLDTVHKTESELIAGENVIVYVAGTGLLTSTDPASEEGAWLEDYATGEIAAIGKVTDSTTTTLDATFAAMPPPGKYWFVIGTRSGRSAECAIIKARRKVSVVAP